MLLSVPSLIIAAQPVEAATAPCYAALDLGTLSGHDSRATGVTSRGQVVGGGLIGETFTFHAFQYPATSACPLDPDSSLCDLGTLARGRRSMAMAINDRGQVVGYSDTVPDGMTGNAFQYDGKLHDLGRLGGNCSESYDINSYGQVVGLTHTPEWAGHAFLRTPTRPNAVTGTMIALGTLPGGRNSNAYGINDRDQVTGWSEVGAESHAVLWTPTTPAAAAARWSTSARYRVAAIALVGTSVRRALSSAQRVRLTARSTLPSPQDCRGAARRRAAASAISGRSVARRASPAASRAGARSSATRNTVSGTRGRSSTPPGACSI
jgi:probable HAF family extracellular repeat protein